MEKILIDALLGNSLSKEEKDSVYRDIMLNEHDPMGESLMKEVWNSCPAGFGKSDMAGLRRFRKHMRRSSAVEQGWNRMALRISVAAFAVCLAFVLGLSVRPGGIWGEKVTLLSSGSISSYTLPDGSRVRLNSGSTLSYTNSLKGHYRRVSLDGQAFFDVARNPRHPFIVQMNKLKLEVLGTSFDASCFKDSEVETVTLKTGSVKVSVPAHGDPVIMKPNQVLEYDVFDGEYSMKNTDAMNSCRWFEPYINFDNVRFDDVLTNVASRYRVRIHNNASELSDKRMSLTIDDDSLDLIMEVISELIPVGYEIRGNELFINSN